MCRIVRPKGQGPSAARKGKASTGPRQVFTAYLATPQGSPLLRWQFAGASEELEELQRVDQRNAITSSLLIPLSEPEQARNLLYGEAPLRQGLCFHKIIVSIHLTVE